MTPRDMDGDLIDEQILMPDDLAAKFDAIGPENILFQRVKITPDLNYRAHVKNLLSMLRVRPDWTAEDAIRLAAVFPDGFGILRTSTAQAIRELWSEIAEEIKAARPKPPVLTVLTPAECEAARPAPYVIKGILGRGDTGLLVAAPGGGKSALAPLLGYSVAQGRLTFGRRVSRGAVLYLSSEDGTGMKVRIRVLRQKWGEAQNFSLVPHATDLMDPAGAQLAAVKELIELRKPVLVIIDTVAASFPGLRESDGDSEGGMGRVARVARELASVCGSAVLMLHHPPLEGTRGRGHGALNADVDVNMWIDGEKGQPRTVRFSKNRNGTSDQTLTFAIRVEALGEDEDGDPITAAIAEEIEATASDTLRAKEAKLRDKPATLLREFRSAMAAQSEPVSPVEGMPIVLAVTRDTLRQRLIAAGWFPENMLCTDDAGKPKLVRAAYAAENNAISPLRRNGFLACTRDWVWAP